MPRGRKAGRKSKASRAECDEKESIEPFTSVYQQPINGNSAVASKRRKVAPRSSEQFKVGPDFNETRVNRNIYITSSNELINPELKARIDRGFDFMEDEWIGYKRNYFTLVAAFLFIGKEQDLFFHEKFHIVDDDENQLNIKCFALRLVSECCENDIRVTLVQHTPKRDRGPQYQPPVYPSVSGTIPDHNLIKQSANIRNDNKIEQLNKLFYLDQDTCQSISTNSILHDYPEGKISTAARYERMQFSTSVNYRKPALINRHFILRVELLAVLDDGRYAILASIDSPPLVVRGRSPSNYQLSRLKTVKPIKSYDNLSLQSENNLMMFDTNSQLKSDKLLKNGKHAVTSSIINQVDNTLNFGVSGTNPIIYDDSTSRHKKKLSKYDYSSVLPEELFNEIHEETNDHSNNDNKFQEQQQLQHSSDHNSHVAPPFSLYGVEDENYSSSTMNFDVLRSYKEKKHKHKHRRHHKSRHGHGDHHRHTKHKHKSSGHSSRDVNALHEINYNPNVFEQSFNNDIQNTTVLRSRTSSSFSVSNEQPQSLVLDQL